MTLTLLWPDGEVSTGRDNLTSFLLAQEYGHADETPTVVRNVEGQARPVRLARRFDGWTGDDWGYPEWDLFDGDAAEPFDTIILRVDGRA